MTDEGEFDVVADHPRMAIPETWTFENPGVAQHFDRHVREQLPWYDMATAGVVHIARHYIPEGGKVYDIGASTGNIGRALLPTLDERGADITSIERSPEMCKRFTGPEPLVCADATEFNYMPFDFATLFLVLMFVPYGKRAQLLSTLGDRLRPGGAIVVFDKCEGLDGYPGTILRRLTLAGKVAGGATPEDIVAKELSLGGVQRPLDPAVLSNCGLPVVEWFRFGEFSGWLMEKKG